MPKRRRKLSAELEKEIASAIRKVELTTAIINDIADEEIQGEYRQAFDQIRAACIFLSTEYQKNGVTTQSEAGLEVYKALLNKFEEEYEIWV